REWTYLRRTLEGRDRFRDSIEGGLCNSPVDRSEMKRQGILFRCRPGAIAHLLCVRRPLDRERLRTPKPFGHCTVRPLGHAIHHTRRVDQAHLYWIQWRT